MSTPTPSLRHLVASELLKVRSTRLWWALLLGAVVFTALQAGVNAAFAGAETTPGQPPTPSLDTAEAIRSVYATSTFAGSYLLALVLGVTGMTGEYRYRTITPTFLASPRRSRVVAAKMLTHLGVGALFGLVALLTALVVGGVVVVARGHDLGLGADGVWPACALAVCAVALWTLIGIGVGTLVRNQVGAIVLAVAVEFLVEPLATFGLGALDLDGVAKFLPSNASTALTSPGEVVVSYLDWWAGGLVLLGYAVLLAGLGALVSVRRDVA